VSVAVKRSHGREHISTWLFEQNLQNLTESNEYITHEVRKRSTFPQYQHYVKQKPNFFLHAQPTSNHNHHSPINTIMSSTTDSPRWHPIPSSPSKTTCTVHMLQAGGLTIPTDMVLLPGPNKPNDSISNHPNSNDRESFYVPDYTFLIHHPPTNSHYLFDLGMRTDLQNLPPTLVKSILPVFHCTPLSAAALLKQHGTADQQPDNVKAVIFSHVHFDHLGDGAVEGFKKDVELWVGPTCCTYARPGYPDEADAPVLSDNFPIDGSRKIVEAYIPDELLERAGDSRVGKVAEGKKQGKYKGTTLQQGGGGERKEWMNLGCFPHAFDVFNDGSAYLIDAPGHSAGHQMMLVRVKINGDDDTASTEDNFVLLAGDCFHHPALLKDPKRTARPPYAKSGMHLEPEVAIETMERTKMFSEKDNVFVLGAHDFSVGSAIAPGEKVIEGLVKMNDWREKGWKAKAHASLS
jgi:glyoxylase-like metal-dependent hydrolase (beta-lactamase superfamily II)